jgi:uncharacterized protein
MNPFYFGTNHRRLFGIYEAAHAIGGPVRGAVICNPLGAEQVYAHRALRQLSRKLNAAGVDVLRFDYFGTGDSAGDMTDADLTGWESDIRSAIAELESVDGSMAISLIGLRLGATLAAKVAASQGSKVNTLVLWDPVQNGLDYLHELYAASRMLPTANGKLLSRPAELGGGYEILGFSMTANLLRELEALDLLALAPDLLRRTLVITSGSQASPSKPCTLLRGNSARGPVLEEIEAVPCWINPWGIAVPGWVNSWGNIGGILPVHIISRICQWLG